MPAFSFLKKPMLAVLIVVLPTWSEANAQKEATSLAGAPLLRPVLPEKVRADFEAKLKIAQQNWQEQPGVAETWIWLGRRTAYLGRYQEAIRIFSQGLERFPDEPRLYRHRGHRYLTTRQIGKAIADFEKAATLVEGKADQIEPDGLPNAKNIPTSTLQTNIWYHLGLAHYVSGDMAKAEQAYRRCLALSRNADMWCATAHWLYMSLRRQGKEAAAQAVVAPVRADMEIIENEGYFQLVQAYKDPALLEKLRALEHEDGVQSATMAYGLANAHYYNGDLKAAKAALENILAGPAWAAFGFLAAEADWVGLSANPGKSP